MRINEDRTILPPLRYAFLHRAPNAVNVAFSQSETKVLRLVLNELANGHVLEIGSGLGRWTSVLVENKIDITGCDILENSIQILRKKFPDTTFKRNSEDNLPFKDEEFDMIFWANVVNTPGLNKNKFYAETFRVLKKGGKIIFFEVDTDLACTKKFKILRIINLGMGFTYTFGRFLFFFPKNLQEFFISVLERIDKMIYRHYSKYKLYILRK